MAAIRAGNTIFGNTAGTVTIQHISDCKVSAETDFKLARCKQKGEPTETKNDAELKKRMNAIDRQRARYYQFHTGRTWGEKSFYDLCINTTQTDIKSMSIAIADVIQRGNR